jgi:hypothetical protein
LLGSGSGCSGAPGGRGTEPSRCAESAMRVISIGTVQQPTTKASGCAGQASRATTVGPEQSSVSEPVVRESAPLPQPDLPPATTMFLVRQTPRYEACTVCQSATGESAAQVTSRYFISGAGLDAPEARSQLRQVLSSHVVWLRGAHVDQQQPWIAAPA